MAAGAAARQLEGEADAALDAHAGVDRPLGRHLVRRAPAQDAALAGVGPLGVLTHDGEVDAAAGVGERTEVHVEVEPEAELEEEAALQHARGDVRRPHGAQQDGVEAAHGVELVVGQYLASAQVALASEVELGDAEIDTGGAHHLEGLGHDLGADAVSSYDAYSMGHEHVLQK